MCPEAFGSGVGVGKVALQWFSIGGSALTQSLVPGLPFALAEVGICRKGAETL